MSKTTTHPGCRIFVIGAGFSRPAGLPLASSLFGSVATTIRGRYGTDTKFERDLRNFLEYCEACGLKGGTDEHVDLEAFMSYLDIEHFLELRGSDTWSSEGNESQLMIRSAIGQVIHRSTPAQHALPDFYYRFAEALSPHDTVLTFNYDLVVERALRHVGKPFRRFPNRFKSITDLGGIVDNEVDEVVLLKLHGSVDWFDDRRFLESKASMEAKGFPYKGFHSVFDDRKRFAAKPLADSPLPQGDLLAHIHTIEGVDAYYAEDSDFNAPFILSPSHVKFVYAEPLLSFWNGMGRGGAYNLGISVIGFSLPEHDEYIRIGLYQMLSNYASWWNEPMLGVLKDYSRFVDYKPTDDEKESYKRRYGFAGADRARHFFGGFGNEAIEFLFNQPRES